MTYFQTLLPQTLCIVMVLDACALVSCIFILFYDGIAYI